MRRLGSKPAQSIFKHFSGDENFFLIDPRIMVYMLMIFNAHFRTGLRWVTNNLQLINFQINKVVPGVFLGYKDLVTLKLFILLLQILKNKLC